VLIDLFVVAVSVEMKRSASCFQTLDVPKYLLNLRRQRMIMVQTLSQYTFIYKVIIQYLRNSRLI